MVDTATPDPARLLPRRGYITLETYEKDGTPKQTPMDAIQEDGLIYARADYRSNKVRRIRGNPRVRVARSDLSGKPKGDWLYGEARTVEGKDYAVALRAFRKEYGLFGSCLMGFMARRRGQILNTVISITIKPSPVAA